MMPWESWNARDAAWLRIERASVRQKSSSRGIDAAKRRIGEGLLHLLHEECQQLADANSDALADALN